ncbi:S-layer homology domain-containing protein [Paenibacillus roseipurpureus]|uniref:S-layer homology domain-containing protein n=1 Tax=Paenibacillus roseopurpureus TaxID=2918901 RepID=A0AA96LLA9_9BACL|nr:S-layer homology domain-containing protein [Paenibacillus sp. MBLB1832]WNR43845.1 S-layer homology domain-containing protein [Paenibacillus sp. MBLB1832]
MPTYFLNVRVKCATASTDVLTWTSSNTSASAQKLGIIDGMSDGSFAPQGNATRAQAATIIYKLFSQS